MSRRQIQLGDFINNGDAELQTGPFGTQLKAADYTTEGTPVINVRNIGYGALRPDKLEHVPDAVVNRLAKHILKPNDIVFGRKGSVDRHLLVREKESGWLQGSDCIRLRIFTDDLNPYFFSFILRLEKVKQWFLTQCANKATMASLNQDVISRFTFGLPNKSKQNAIASILSSYDNLIENNRRRIQLLEQAARLLHKEWFVHLRFPGHEHVKVTNGVPEGWIKKPLGEIAYITMGQSPKSIYYNQDGDGLPFHQGVTNFGFRFPSHKTYCRVQSRLAEPGDILFSVRAPVGRINLSRDKIVIGRGLAAIRDNQNRQNFLFYALKSHFFKEDMMGGGAIFAAITKKDLHGVKLIVPPERIANMFMEHVQPIDLLMENLQQTIEGLSQARNLLLPRLMNGEITV